MTRVRHVAVGVPAVARPAAGDLEARVRGAVERVWSDGALLSRPRVSLVDGEPGAVTVDDRPLVLSARGLELAVLAGSGAIRRTDEPSDTRELLSSRLAVASPGQASALVTTVADARLRAATSDLVEDESQEIAAFLITRGHPAPRELLARAVAVASRVGLLPRGLQSADHHATDVSEDAHELAELLVSRSMTADDPTPSVELRSSTLRRLASDSTGFRGELMVGGSPPGPVGLRSQLHRDYGVYGPTVSLATADQPGDLARFAFGSLRSAAHLVIPDDDVVLTADPECLPSDLDARSYLDPASGESWSVVRRNSQVDEPGVRRLDPAALVVHALFAEMKTRLAWWVPPIAEQLAAWPPVRARIPGVVVRGVMRRLLASQVSVHDVSRLREGFLVAADLGQSGILEVEATVRAVLGRAVASPVLSIDELEVVDLEEAVASDVVGRRSLTALVALQPTLTTSTGRLMVRCADRYRSEIEDLLHPLDDVTIVVSDEEYPRLPTQDYTGDHAAAWPTHRDDSVAQPVDAR